MFSPVYQTNTRQTSSALEEQRLETSSCVCVNHCIDIHCSSAAWMKVVWRTRGPPFALIDAAWSDHPSKSPALRRLIAWHPGDSKTFHLTCGRQPGGLEMTLHRWQTRCHTPTHTSHTPEHSLMTRLPSLFRYICTAGLAAAHQDFTCFSHRRPSAAVMTHRTWFGHRTRPLEIRCWLKLSPLDWKPFITREGQRFPAAAAASGKLCPLKSHRYEVKMNWNWLLKRLCSSCYMYEMCITLSISFHIVTFTWKHGEPAEGFGDRDPCIAKIASKQTPGTQRNCLKRNTNLRKTEKKLHCIAVSQSRNSRELQRSSVRSSMKQVSWNIFYFKYMKKMFHWISAS